MTGNRLRELLTLGNVSIKGLAEKLNMTQPNLSAQFKVQDVKSGILERICEVLGVTMQIIILFFAHFTVTLHPEIK